MSHRVSDFALLIGHVWRCSDCREAIMTQPDVYWIGFKLSDVQREVIRSLTDESFQTIMRLSEITSLTPRELDDAIDHPRARLRHLGVVKYDQRTNGR